MFEITNSMDLSLNSVLIAILITLLISAFVIFTTIMDYNLKKTFITTKLFFKKLITGSNEIDKHLKEILDCIKNHKDPNKIEILKKLAENNKNLINYPYGSLENTPFLAVCEQGATEIAKEMLKMGADIKYTNLEGNGPMYLAVYYLCKNRGEIDASLIRTLYYCGCDINIKNKKGYTPLHLAAYFGHVPLIHWLLSKGADVNIPPLSSGIALANEGPCIRWQNGNWREYRRMIFAYIHGSRHFAIIYKVPFQNAAYQVGKIAP